MSLQWVDSACPKLTHPLTLEICSFCHILYSAKGPAHRSSHSPPLPYSCSQLSPPLFSHSPLPFKVLHVPGLDYLKSLLNCLPSPSLCSTTACAVAWLTLLRRCFVMPHSCSRIRRLSIHSQRTKPTFLSLSQDITLLP